MYGQSHDMDNIFKRRSEIKLQTRDKIKFKVVFTINIQVLNVLHNSLFDYHSPKLTLI